jgi:hypothetical protein
MRQIKNDLSDLDVKTTKDLMKIFDENKLNV